MYDFAARPIARQIFGSCVVLPEPVSPATITTWCSSTAFAMSITRAVIGKFAGNTTRSLSCSPGRRTLGGGSTLNGA